MNYGVVLPIWQLTVAEAESLSTRAEELGLDGVFVPDHVLAKPATTQHYGGHWPDPFALLAFLAGRTRRIHLGASVIVLPYRNALVAAKAAATVDQASGGRFIFGVGVGWDEAEFVDLRLPFHELDEGLLPEHVLPTGSSFRTLSRRQRSRAGSPVGGRSHRSPAESSAS